MPKSQVDIIIPTFNRSSTLDRAIQSVFNQEFKQYTLWVVDDHSTDNTFSILQKWQSLFPPRKMRILKLKKNKGVSTARNKGIQAGQAPYIAFLDSDDEWTKHKLRRQKEWAEKHPEHPLIHSNEIWIRKGKRMNQKKKHQKAGGRVFMDNLELCRISPSAVMIQREYLNKVGLFREDFPVCEDYDLWLKISSRTKVGFINEPLVVKHGGHPDQLSRKYKAMDEWRARALFSHLNSAFINQEEKQKLIYVLKKKCQILLNGYKKHNNHVNEEEIRNIYEKACEHDLNIEGKTTPTGFSGVGIRKGKAFSV